MEDQNDSQQSTNFLSGIFSKLKLFLVENRSIAIFIAVLVIVSFGSTTYLLMTNKEPALSDELPQIKISPIPSPMSLPKVIISNAPTATPIPTIIPEDPTATWSAFVSSKYSYSIKYPLNWNAQITTQQDPKILEYVVFNPTATKAGTLSITLSYGTRTYLEALALDPQIGESILVASASSTRKSSKDSNGYKAANVFVPVGLNSIVFNAKDAYTTFFNQMLTTLKLPK